MIYRFTITRVPEGWFVDEETLFCPPGSGIHPSLERARQCVESAVGGKMSWKVVPGAPEAGNGEETVWKSEAVEVAIFTRVVNPRLKTDPDPAEVARNTAALKASLPRLTKKKPKAIPAAPVPPPAGNEYEDWL